MSLEKNASLQPYNTFGVPASTKYLGIFNSVEELRSILKAPEVQGLPLLILGGGSNILFTRDWEGLCLLNRITGIEVVEEDDKHVWVKAGAGEVWHDFVLYAIEKGLGGIENLSLIPGNVGAAPMQNIGAYGVELKETFESLRAMELSTGELHTFNREECRFGYRESVFKKELKDRYVICDVTLRLSKHPELNLDYGAIRSQLAEMGIAQPTIRSVSQAVINIRSSKLPNPKETGNAGSFFKNPVVSASRAEEIIAVNPDIPNYPAGEKVKFAAGWLIEQAGWKGYRRDGYGVHHRQALVLVNHGGSTGKQIYALSEEIEKSVKEKFGITLEREVNIV